MIDQIAEVIVKAEGGGRRADLERDGRLALAALKALGGRLRP